MTTATSHGPAAATRASRIGLLLVALLAVPVGTAAFYFVVVWYPETGEANTRVRIGGSWKPVHVISREDLRLVARLAL